MTNYVMTPEGKKQLEEELRRLREVDRLKIIKDIEEARAHGDISENSEYEDAKERQAMCEGRIQDIEAKLSMVQVIDVTTLPGQELDSDDEDKVVVFGATVIVEDEEEHTSSYKIVGVDESDVSQGKISYQTPVAKALLGKSPGDEVEVTLPLKSKTYEIIEVHYK
jgi:transcription elongation factor GreA